MIFADVPWDKIITGVLAALGMWCAPRAYRAVRNLGKSEAQRADEDLEAALRKAEQAHSNNDPSDDAAADAAVARAKAMRVRALRLKAIADGIAGEE